MMPKAKTIVPDQLERKNSLVPNDMQVKAEAIQYRGFQGRHKINVGGFHKQVSM